MALEVMDRHAVKKPALRRPMLVPVFALAAILLATMLIAAGVGAAPLPLSEIIGAVLGRQHLTAMEASILFSIRLPRIFAAAMVGSALSVSGLLFQGLFRNPLADPYVIGSSGGAVLGASIGVFLLPPLSVAGFSLTALLAFGGATCSILLVYALASVNGRTPVVALLLAGFAVSTMLGYSSYFLESLDRDFGAGMRALISWLHGTITQPTWPQLAIEAAMLALAYGASVPIAARLNTLALGEEYALSLGLDVQRTRISLIVAGSVLTASAVALGGMISFVGLIVPHAMRLLFGSDHLRLLPSTALAGAIFLLVADTFARTILAPAELPVGVFTACLGAPFFLYLLRQAKAETLL